MRAVVRGGGSWLRRTFRTPQRSSRRTRLMVSLVPSDARASPPRQRAVLGLRFFEELPA